jgi:hypothetical protein
MSTKVRKKRRYFDESADSDSVNEALLNKFVCAIDIIKSYSGDLNKLTYEQLVTYLTIALGGDLFYFLHYLVYKHVPQGFPNRIQWIKKLFATSDKIGVINLENYIHALDIHHYLCDPLDKLNDEQVHKLWKAATDTGEATMAFFMPNIMNCLNCGDAHLSSYARSVTDITVYTLQGPLPCLKASLTCRVCSATHGLTGYSHKGSRTMYSDINFSNYLVESSNKVYITKEVHELMCESG